ncbi:hypothetical protein [Phormidium tenue]|uniref:Uncharacterized protein n=1 Tax=Phormidium tenue NIES-30 TaxID=549789 RepID=A0A1U7J262_9CYAN|nr:hypothetical protein [Phormidium tenue]MBD2233735.1 hypothetical protein [Phormidium tenue FACHB-1052]OKH46154.1 hypothetical protein NIES30_17810 [Phormidium tenue NIES-30]
MDKVPIVLPKPIQDELEALAQQQNRTVLAIIQDAVRLYITTLHSLQARTMTMDHQNQNPPEP